MGLEVCSGHSEVWKPYKVGGCTSAKCTQKQVRFEPHGPRYGQITVLAHNEPEMGFGVGKTAQNGPRCAPCWVSYGPKRSIDTSLAIHLAPFRVSLGHFCPTFGPWSNLCHCEEQSDHQRELTGSSRPKLCPFDGPNVEIPSGNGWGLSRPPYPRYDFGSTPGPPACCLFAAGSA